MTMPVDLYLVDAILRRLIGCYDKSKGRSCLWSNNVQHNRICPEDAIVLEASTGSFWWADY